MEELYLNKQAP